VTKSWPGRPFPLGATWDGAGTNFAIFSENAERVELCLRAADGSERRIALTEPTAHIWPGYLHGLGPGPRHGHPVPGSGPRLSDTPARDPGPVVRALVRHAYDLDLLDAPVPFHPGALKYFKERGVKLP